MSSSLWRAVEDAWHADDERIGPLQVYADWLQSQGDPHGELITLGCALQEARRDPSAYRRLQALYEKRLHDLEPRLFGRRLRDTDGLSYRTLCGFLDYLLIDTSRHDPTFVAGLLDRPGSALLRQIALARAQQPEDEPRKPVRQYLGQLRSRHHLRSLALNYLALDERALTVLSQCAALQTLRLRRCRVQPDSDTSAGAGWLARLEDLRELELWSDDLPLSTTAALGQLSRLRECDVHVPEQHPTECLGHILQLPALDRLSVTFHRSIPDQCYSDGGDLSALGGA